jgi:hypothetical protein
MCAVDVMFPEMGSKCRTSLDAKWISQRKKSNKYVRREIPGLAQRVRASIGTHAAMGFLSVTSAGRRVAK